MPPPLDRISRLATLEAEVRTRYAEAARSLWHIGECLLEVQRDELWRDAGHDGFSDWLDRAGMPVSRASAYKAMRVAEHFNSDMASRFGTEKLDAAVGYLQATGKDEQPGDLLAVQVRIRGEDGAFTTVPFIQASATQIREAVRLLGHAHRDTRVPGEVQGQVSQLNRALPKAAGDYKGASVAVRRNRAGKMVLSCKGVPLDDLEGFWAVLREHLGGK